MEFINEFMAGNPPTFGILHKPYFERIAPFRRSKFTEIIVLVFGKIIDNWNVRCTFFKLATPRPMRTPFPG